MEARYALILAFCGEYEAGGPGGGGSEPSLGESVTRSLTLVTQGQRLRLPTVMSGHPQGLPEFNEDILRCIISFLVVRVAPVADWSRC